MISMTLLKKPYRNATHNDQSGSSLPFLVETLASGSEPYLNLNLRCAASFPHLPKYIHPRLITRRQDSWEGIKQGKFVSAKM